MPDEKLDKHTAYNYPFANTARRFIEVSNGFKPGSKTSDIRSKPKRKYAD